MPDGAPHAVDRLASLLAEDLAAVEALIHRHMTSPVGVIPNLAAHLIDAGGKRIRPLITLAAARLVGAYWMAQNPNVRSPKQQPA